MNVCRFGFPLEGTLKHFLRRDILASVQFNNSAVIKRVRIARQNAFRSQTRLCNGEIGTSASSYLCNLRVFVYENSKLIAGFSEPTSCKLLVRSFKRHQCRRLILCRWTRRRRCWSG